MGIRKKVIWGPQPGPQVEAVTCPCDFTFFGGSRGGGKSDALLGRQIMGAIRYGTAWNGLVLRRKYKDFAELRRRTDELIVSGLPCERIGGDQQVNAIRFDNGANFKFVAVHRLSIVNDFVGQQFTEISIDECTTFPFFSKMVDKLQGSCRSPHGVPSHFFGTGNPGGVGHNEVKQFFQLGSGGLPPKTIMRDEIETPSGIVHFTKIYIPSFLKDNHILCKNDPRYVAKLMAIRDPALRRAWLDGDWDVFIGQSFVFTAETHVVENNFPIPTNAQIYMTFDWGYGAPFSIGWWWVDDETRIFRFNEWYGWNGEVDTGLRLEDSKIAEGILDREALMGLEGRQDKIIRLCDPTCFNKKPDYKGGGQGPSTAEVFKNFGIHLRPGDPNRSLKIRQIRERLAIPENKNELPLLVVYRRCEQFIRTIPTLCNSEENPEDIDQGQEDHCYDEAALIAMARPVAVKVSNQNIKAAKTYIEKIESKLDNASKAAWRELRAIQKENEEEDLEDGEYIQIG